jgi:hypothetical protein
MPQASADNNQGGEELVLSNHTVIFLIVVHRVFLLSLCHSDGLRAFSDLQQRHRKAETHCTAGGESSSQSLSQFLPSSVLLILSW